MSVSKMSSLNALFVLFTQPKDIQFTVTEERNQKMFTFKKLESENLTFLLNVSNRFIDYQNSWWQFHKKSVLAAQTWALQDEAVVISHVFPSLLINLTIIFSIIRWVVCSTKRLKMTKNVNHRSPNLSVNGLIVAMLTFTETLYWVNGELFADNSSKPTVI